MSGRKWYEWLLWIVYLLMAAVCLYLNFFGGVDAGITNLIVNAAMFVMVAVIFINCEAHAFAPANRMIGDLYAVCQRIREDAANARQPLWSLYREKGELLFTDEILRDRYAAYVRELEMRAATGREQIHSDPEDYIGEDLADDVLHRNLINQVPGALTGLGILGTFVGLSLGLQSFATGSTSEITGSISPLMSGIKVAFHTSIYGMVFSLVFNYVFKRKLEQAEQAIRAFLRDHKSYVMPDARLEGQNMMLDLMRQQIAATKTMTDTISESLADGMEELLEPQFDRFDKTISRFAEGAEKNQLDALGLIVNGFIAEMNKSLGNSFSQLSYTIDQTFKLQQTNTEQLKQVLEGTADQTARYGKWLEDQEQLIRALHEDIGQMPESTAATVRTLQESMLRSDAQFKDMVKRLETMTEQVPYTYSAAYDGVRDVLAEVQRSIERLNDSLVETIERLDAAGRAGARDRSSIFGKKP